MATTYSGTTPKHLWIAGILSLLWNGYGAYDYLMTELDPVGYLSGAGFGPEVVAWFESFPAWTIAIRITTGMIMASLPATSAGRSEVN